MFRKEMVPNMSFFPAARAMLRSRAGCDFMSRNHHRYLHYLRHSAPTNVSLERATTSIVSRNCSRIQIGRVHQKNPCRRFYSTTRTTSALSLESTKETRPTSASSDYESFEVKKIDTETGEIETIKMSQTEIIMQTALSPRDLVSLRLSSKRERKEHWVGNTLMEQMRHPPTIMARNDFILLSLGPVRAVAEKNAVYLFDIYSKPASSFTNYLSEVYQKRSARIKNASQTNNKSLYNEDPTELVFLETVLADAVDSFSSRIRIFEPVVNDLLKRLSTDEEISNTNLVHQMAPLIEQLKSFEIFVTQAHDCLMGLINDDDAMLELLLTEQEGTCWNNFGVSMPLSFGAYYLYP